MAYFYDEINEFADLCAQVEVTGYDQALTRFEAWLRSNEIPVRKLTRTKAKAYLDYLKQQEFTPFYAKINLQIVNDFYSWLYSSQNLSPFRGMVIKTAKTRNRRPRTPHQIRTLTERQVDILRGSIKRIYDDPFLFYRAHLIIALPLYMGVQLSELHQLSIREVTGRDAFLELDGRDVPYTPQMKQLVRHYLAYRAVKVRHDESALLVNRSGVAMTATSLRREVALISEESKIKADVRTLIDTFTYNLVIDGAPVHVIMKMRNCTHAKALEYINIALKGEDAAEAYEKSVAQRMRAVKRKARRVQ